MRNILRYAFRYTYLGVREIIYGRPETTYIPDGVRERVDLTTGGFIEFEQSDDRHVKTSSIRIHLGKPKHSHDLDETYKYSRYGTCTDNYKLLIELRDALNSFIR